MRTPLRLLAEACEAVAATASKLKKVDIVAGLLRSLGAQEVPAVARYLAGYTLPKALEKEPNVGFSTIAKVTLEVSGASDAELSHALLTKGDLGAAAQELLQKRSVQALDSEPLAVSDIGEAFERMALASGQGSTSVRKSLLKGLLLRATPLEAKYIIKFLTGELRIGLEAGLLEESLAQAFGKAPPEVRRLRLVVGDLGEVASLLAKGEEVAHIAPGRPVAYMLADSLSTPQEIADHFGKEIMLEYKYDGVRAQVHKRSTSLKLFSRRLEEVTKFFPEVTEAFSSLVGDFVVDGEIVAYRKDRPLPFYLLQKRLRRKSLEGYSEEIPVAYFAYDVLYRNGLSTLELPLRERRKILEDLGFRPPAYSSQVFSASRSEEIAGIFERSLEEGFEGLVAKDPDSPYTPGKRGSLWVKLKRELDTLDCVVVAAEYGHGKRAGWLSDYVFAVWDQNELKVIGKAYSGVTDAEIAWMTSKLRELATREAGFRLCVKPEIVVEVAFDAIHRSDRHSSGFALRFPRIKRIRSDKGPRDADSMEKVREVYRRQLERYGAEEAS